VALLSQTADDFSRSLDVWRFIILALCAYFLFFRSDAAVLSRTTFPERWKAHALLWFRRHSQPRLSFHALNFATMGTTELDKFNLWGKPTIEMGIVKTMNLAGR
jgi:hypothetical protein